MRLIKIKASKSGGHFAYTIDHISKIPEGWAVIPDDMETPNFPYGEITVEEVDGVMVVTKWVATDKPVAEETPKEPSATEIIDTLLGVTGNE